MAQDVAFSVRKRVVQIPQGSPFALNFSSPSLTVLLRIFCRTAPDKTAFIIRPAGFAPYVLPHGGRPTRSLLYEIKHRCRWGHTSRRAPSKRLEIYSLNFSALRRSRRLCAIRLSRQVFSDEMSRENGVIKILRKFGYLKQTLVKIIKFLLPKRGRK